MIEGIHESAIGVPPKSEQTKPEQTESQAKQKTGGTEPSGQKYQRIIDSLETLTPIQKEFLKSRWLDQMLWFTKRAKQSQQWYYRVRVVTIFCSVIVPAFVSWGGSMALNDANKSASPTANNSASIAALSTLAAGLPPNASMLNASATEGTGEKLAVNKSDSGLIPNSVASTDPINWSRWALVAAFALSQIVAVGAALEQFFKFGDRWRRYRRSAELLKSHGWQFFQLSGAYAACAKTEDYQGAFILFATQIEEIIQSDVEGYISQITTQKQADKQQGDNADDS